VNSISRPATTDSGHGGGVTESSPRTFVSTSSRWRRSSGSPIGSVGTWRIESKMIVQLLKNGSIGNGPDFS
jgi:hypothetical protein